MVDAIKAEGVPMGTFYGWLEDEQSLSEMYARARESRGELLAEEIIAIADTANDRNANAVRVKVDARKWCAARMAPKRWGDRIEVAGSKEQPLQVQVEVIGGE